MKTAQELYNERLSRLKKAIELQKPDRVPVIAFADSFCAAYTGTKMSKFSLSPKLSGKMMLKTFLDFKDFDATETSNAAVKVFAFSYLTKIKTAGRELPEGSLWQIDERERMTVQDYDYIINNGWNKFVKKINKEKLNFSTFTLISTILGSIKAAKNFKKAGIPVLSSAYASPPAEIMTTARSMPKFIRDLYRMPDKVEAAMDVAVVDLIETARKTIRQAKPFSVFLAHVRGASEFYSPKLWERFIWKYLKKVVEAIVEEGVYVNLHLDSNWERDLEYFKELPKGKCIWATDHMTDIYKLKKVLGDRMCIKGDVPPSMLTLASPDEVYNYCKKLIKDIGPTGFILAPGCTVPMNAKVENVKAMLSAVTGK